MATFAGHYHSSEGTAKWTTFNPTRRGRLSQQGRPPFTDFPRHCSNKYSYSGDEATLDFSIKKAWFFTVMKIDPMRISSVNSCGARR